MSGSIAFVTRKFPPSIGGMETLSAGVWRSIHVTQPGAVLVSHGGKNRALLWWIPMSLVRLAWLCARRQVSYILCGDALMNAVCAPISAFCRVRRATMIMGLDVTYDHPVYRLLTRRVLRHTAHVIAISEATAQAARDIGVPSRSLAVLRLGVQPPQVGGPPRTTARQALVDQFGLQGDARILLSLGRLVPRKGVVWFTENVLPQLSADVEFLVAGSGPDELAVREASERLGVAPRVHLLGQVSDEMREILMTGADIFVQPNVPVPGDMEGFGLVTVEAAVRGTLVLASALEGIKDAVIDGVTGILIEPENAWDWVRTIMSLPTDDSALHNLGQTYAASASETFGEAVMGQALVSLLGLD